MPVVATASINRPTQRAQQPGLSRADGNGTSPTAGSNRQHQSRLRCRTLPSTLGHADAVMSSFALHRVCAPAHPCSWCSRAERSAEHAARSDRACIRAYDWWCHTPAHVNPPNMRAAFDSMSFGRSTSRGASSIAARSGTAGDAPTQAARRGGSPERPSVAAAAAAHSDRQAPGGTGDSGAGAAPGPSGQGSAAQQGSAALGLGLGSVVGAARPQSQFTVVNAQVLRPRRPPQVGLSRAAAGVHELRAGIAKCSTHLERTMTCLWPLRF